MIYHLLSLVEESKELQLHAKVRASRSISGLDKPGRSGDLFPFIVYM